MTDINEEAQFDNFFALFEQPVQFDLVQEQLNRRLHHLQKQYHPDNVSKQKTNINDSRQTPMQAEQVSALINQAYQTLSAPDSRAAYLLDLAGQGQNLEHSIADLDFLEDAMEMRIELDDAIQAKNGMVLQQLHPQVTDRLEAQSNRFVTAYDNNNWQEAIDATQKLKFLVKLNADIATGLDEITSVEHSDDDDLYV